MCVPLLDLKAQYETIRGEIETAVKEVFETQRFILGPEVKEFEDAVARYCGINHAIGCASGSDAILLALMALGVGPGDEVVTTPYTFFATDGCISRLGATQRYCDIRPETFNIDPDGIEPLITGKTKAIIAVHLFGLAADMDRITDIADSHGLPVIEDAAQAIGASTPSGKAGSLGAAGCLSFFPSKNLGGAGDGGMVVTDNDDLAEKIRILRVHGASPKYHHRVVGFNSRLDALQAAVLRVKLKYLESWSELRRGHAAFYGKLFREQGLTDYIAIPVVPDGYTHVFNQYVIMAQNRDNLKNHLAENDIGAAIYYPVPLHLQECFSHLGYKQGDFPVSEKSAADSLALPAYPEMTDDMVEYVVDTIAGFYRQRG